MSTETRPDPQISDRKIEPVTIDDQGRIFREDGTQVVVPGLEPDQVLAAIAQDKAGEGKRIVADNREEFMAKFLASFGSAG